MRFEYIYLLSIVFIGLVFSSIIFSISNVLITKSYDLEKISPYECGFDSFEDSRTRFDVKFYFVGILFIIFDLEVIFLFPWSVVLSNPFDYSVMMIFLIVLTLGYIYEWFRGALDWEQ